MKAIAFVVYLIFVLLLPFCLCIPADQFAAGPSIKSKDGFQFLFVNGEDDDGVKVERLRKIFLKFEDALNKNIGKWKGKDGEDIPNLLKFILKDGKLNKDLKHVMNKNVPEMHHDTFLKKLNKFLNNLSNGNVASVHFFKNAVGVKVNPREPMKRKTPVVYEDHSFLTVPTHDLNSEKRQIKYMKKRLQNHVKKWTEPSFMEYEESKLLKKHLTDVALSVFTSPGKILLPMKSEVFIDCIATPQYYANIRWEIENKIIPFYQPGKENGKMFVFPNGTLYIRSLRKRDIGVYTCIASTKTEQRYATSVIAVAYLEHFPPVDPVVTFEGSSEASIKCIPPFGVPPPVLMWKKDGKQIQDPRIITESWTLVIKDIQMSDAGNYTCFATNMAKQRNMTTNLEVIPIMSAKKVEPVDKSAGERLMERWVGEHFTKPHHLSSDETNSDDKSDVNSAVELSDSSDSVEKELQQNGIGRALLKGILEERNDLPWASNDVLSKLTAKQKEDYIKAEREWEMKLTQETQRLLDKLQPADAYIIPDVPIYGGGKTEKLEGREAARVIREQLEDVARRKVMLTGDENWDALDKEKEEKKDDTKWEGGKKLKEKLDEIFQNKLAEEEEEWLGVEQDAYSKLGILEKYAKEKKSTY